MASSQLARLALLFALCRSVMAEPGLERRNGRGCGGGRPRRDYFKAHARRAHFSLYPETPDEKLLRVLGDLLAEKGDYWKATLPEVREALEAVLGEWNVVTNLPRTRRRVVQEAAVIGGDRGQPVGRDGLVPQRPCPDTRAVPPPRVAPDAVGTVGTGNTPDLGPLLAKPRR